MNKNLISDLAILTTIPESNLKKLCNLSKDIISHDVLECIKNNEQICEVDIGIGNLLINLQEESLSFKFIPSKSLQDCLLETIQSKESSLTKNVEKILTDKIIFAYKNLI